MIICSACLLSVLRAMVRLAGEMQSECTYEWEEDEPEWDGFYEWVFETPPGKPLMLFEWGTVNHTWTD